MQSSLDVFLIRDNNGAGYLIGTGKGTPRFGDLDLATWYTSMKAVQNAVSRIKTPFDVRFVKARLEVLG